MSDVLELSADTYQRLIELAQRERQTPEEVIRALLLDYENECYRQANERMFGQGLLTSLPTPQPIQEDDFEPESVPGKPLSEVIIEERR